MKILVIGAGFAGKRHALNLKELKADVSIYDTNPNVMAWTIENKFEWVENYKGNYDGVIIATPPNIHMQNYDQLFSAGLKNFLIEKPLSLTSDMPKKWKLKDLAATDIMMAHNYLFEPLLYEYKKGMISSLRGGQSWDYISLDYMPNWHGVDFANNYKDRHEAKDGCMAVSMPHTIYILDYLFGLPDREEYYKRHNPELKIKGDSSVTGVRVNAGSMVRFIENWAHKGDRTHHVCNSDRSAWPEGSFSFTNTNIDIPKTYKTMMKVWLDVILGARDIPELCRLEEGIRIVKCIEEAKTMENEYE